MREAATHPTERAFTSEVLLRKPRQHVASVQPPTLFEAVVTEPAGHNLVLPARRVGFDVRQNRPTSPRAPAQVARLLRPASLPLKHGRPRTRPLTPRASATSFEGRGTTGRDSCNSHRHDLRPTWGLDRNSVRASNRVLTRKSASMFGAEPERGRAASAPATRGRKTTRSGRVDSLKARMSARPGCDYVRRPRQGTGRGGRRRARRPSSQAGSNHDPSMHQQRWQNANRHSAVGARSAHPSFDHLLPVPRLLLAGDFHERARGVGGLGR